MGLTGTCHPPPVSNMYMCLLSFLPEELLSLVILRLGDLRAQCSAACTCRLLLRLCSEPSVWKTVTFVLPAPMQSEALRRGLAHTERLRVATASRCMGRFCKSAGPAPGALTLTGCGGLTDLGAAALLAPCARLRVLDLTGMTHLSGATLALVLRTFPHLEECTLRSCWQAPSGSASSASGSASSAGWAEGLPEQHALRSLDLSHTQIDHLELLRLMLCTRQLCTLKLNFCEQLREGGLRHAELPSSLASLHVVGCNFSGLFVRQLEDQVLSVSSDDSLMRDAMERSSRRLAAAAEERRQKRQRQLDGSASSRPAAAAARRREDTSSPPPEGSSSATAPHTPLRQPATARRANPHLSSRERSLAQMGDVAEAADSGAWLHEMLCRYHAEKGPAAFDGSTF